MHDSKRTLLVTGATGFLGSAIVAELLQSYPDVRPLLLVRAPDAATGLARVRSEVARILAEPRLASLITEDSILCGTLGSATAALDETSGKRITHVLNAAALASFAWKPEIWDVNIEQTSAFARSVAVLPNVQRFLHVGTAMICGNTTDRLVREDDFPANVRHFVPYTKSKAEIEPRLPGLLGTVPCVIARPSIVVGHTRTGCTASPSIFWVFRMIRAAGRVPFPPGNAIDIVPVDYCASALLELALSDALKQRTYHVSAGAEGCCSFEEIDAAYAASSGEHRSGPLEQFELDELESLQPKFHDWFGPCDERRMSAVVKLYRSYAGLNVRFDNSRLLSEGIAPPPRFVDYLDACRRTGESIPIAEQMLYDFR